MNLIATFKSILKVVHIIFNKENIDWTIKLIKSFNLN